MKEEPEIKDEPAGSSDEEGDSHGEEKANDVSQEDSSQCKCLLIEKVLLLSPATLNLC